MANRLQRIIVLPALTPAVSGLHARVAGPRAHSSRADTGDEEVLGLRVELERAIARAEALERRLAEVEAELQALRVGIATAEAEVDVVELIASPSPPPLPLAPAPAPEAVPLTNVTDLTPPDSEASPSRVSIELVDRGSYPSLRELVVTATGPVPQDDAPGAELATPHLHLESVPLARRESVRQECSFHVEFIADTHFITGLTMDLSTGGVFVATYQRLPVGAPLHLSFELPDGSRVEADGEVRWHRDEEGDCRPGMGVAFTELHADSLRAITRFCRRRAPLFFDV